MKTTLKTEPTPTRSAGTVAVGRAPQPKKVAVPKRKSKRLAGIQSQPQKKTRLSSPRAQRRLSRMASRATQDAAATFAASSKTVRLPQGTSTPTSGVLGLLGAQGSGRGRAAVAQQLPPKDVPSKPKQTKSLMHLLSQRILGIHERFIVARLRPLVPGTGGAYLETMPMKDGIQNGKHSTPRSPRSTGRVRDKGKPISPVSHTDGSASTGNRQSTMKLKHPCSSAMQVAATRHHCKTEKGAVHSPVDISCAYWDDRQQFLEFCSSNRLQFDSLRRAKFSSLVLLQHFVAHAQLRHCSVDTCNNDFIHMCHSCRCEIIDGQRWHCVSCPGFELCSKCSKSVAHRHPLIPFTVPPTFFQLNAPRQLNTE